MLKCNIPVDYVMDRMEMYEIELFMNQLHLVYQESWEQARFLSYMIANNNPFRKKELPITDIMKFSWDDKENNGGKELDEKELNALKDRAKQFEKFINNG